MWSRNRRARNLVSCRKNGDPAKVRSTYYRDDRDYNGAKKYSNHVQQTI